MSRKANGGMAERLKAAVLKTADREVRGFESLSLRQPREVKNSRIRELRKTRLQKLQRLAWELACDLSRFLVEGHPINLVVAMLCHDVGRTLPSTD